MTSRVLVYNKSSCCDADIRSSLNEKTDNVITFDNKYFTVSVEMCFETELPVEEILDTVEAFLFVVDEPKDSVKSVLNCINVFEDFLNDANPEIKLLLLNSEQSEYETEFLEWCIDHEFEFVKLKSSDSGESDESNGLMGESEGFARILGALECHMWPYRIMKDDKPEKQASETYNVVDTALTDLESMMEGDEIGGDFEGMFANMNKIKEVAGQLPDEERKKFAENVALSFWRAMGGDDDEVGGVGDL